MNGDARGAWHRDGMPGWAWVVLVVARLAQIAAVLVPLALAACAWWAWAHRDDPGVRRVLSGAAARAGAAADSVRSVLR